MSMTLRLLRVPIGDITPSPTNPRRTFDEAYLAELADDIRIRGVLSPVLVRPHPIDGYELVFGECRWRAAKQAGLEEIPAMVRELSDVEVIEIQIVENAKRRDVHPLEEADAYRALHETHGFSIDDIAAKLGRSKSYVYGRLRLCGLGEVARAAFFEGRIRPAVAVMLARISDASAQDSATEVVSHGDWLPADAWEYIQRHFMRRLNDAPFDIEDADLVVGPGACTACPHRTGAQAGLFDEIAEEDRCTKPSCWVSKVEAGWERRQEEVRAQGGHVLTAEEKAEHLPYGHLAHSSGYVDLDGHAYLGGAHVPWRDVIGDADYQVTLTRNDSGRVLELVPRELAEAKLEEFRAKAPKDSEAERERAEREERWAKREAERKAEQEARDAQVAELVSRVEKAGPCAAILRAVAECNPSYYVREVMRRRGLDEDAFKSALAMMGEGQLTGLLVEIALEHAEDLADDDEDPFAVFEAALSAAPKGRRNLKKREAKA